MNPRSANPGLSYRSAASAIELQIDELVLEGFAAADRHRIADTIHAELSRLLAAGTLRFGPKSPDVQAAALSLNAPSLAQPMCPELVGATIAQTLATALQGILAQPAATRRDAGVHHAPSHPPKHRLNAMPERP